MLLSEIFSPEMFLLNKLKMCQVRDAVKVKVIGLAKITQTFSRTIFTANVMGLLDKFLKESNIYYFHTMICMTLSEDRGQYIYHVMQSHA